TTDRLFEFAAGTDWFLAFLRANILPSLANHILSLDVVKKFVFPTISQTGINYRHSSLGQHAGDEDFDVKAGDRMPYFLVDEKSIYDKLHQPGFHFLVFSDGKSDCREFRARIDKEYAELVDCQIIPLSPQAAEVFGADKSFGVLLRPDNHI